MIDPFSLALIGVLVLLGSGFGMLFLTVPTCKYIVNEDLALELSHSLKKNLLLLLQQKPAFTLS